LKRRKKPKRPTASARGYEIASKNRKLRTEN
jgi:hypothetical protein